MMLGVRVPTREAPMSQFSGRRLRDIRKQRHLSREQLCVRVGTSMCTITRYEQGRTAPSVNAAAALAEALDVQLTDLLDKEPDPSAGEP